MFNFLKNKQEKLYNLSEAISLDDYVDDDDNVVSIDSNKVAKVKDFDMFDVFIEKRILNFDEGPIDELELGIIDRVNNDVEGKYDGKFVVKDFNQLKLTLQRGFKYFGPTGNYNWINTGNVDSMLRLFKAALSNDVKTFNGDISKWDVSNVKNMLYIFLECYSLTCNISNWDMSNVKYWNKQAYSDTPKEFQEICKRFKIKNHVLWPMK